MKSIIKFLLIFTAITAVVFAPVLLFGGVCRVQRIATPVYSYSYSYAQPVYLRQVYAPYYYAVGQELQLDSLAEKLAQRIEQKLIQRQQSERPQQPQSLVAEKCARCHSPRSKAVLESEAPVFFNELGELLATAEQRASMRTAAKLGSMPPPPAQLLSDDDYLALKAELERGVARSAEPQTQPVPPPPPSPPQP